MTDAEKINFLVKEGEGLTVEFKEHFTPRIDEDIVALIAFKGVDRIHIYDRQDVQDDLLTQFNAAWNGQERELGG